jgi:hypothetical protein
MLPVNIVDSLINLIFQYFFLSRVLSEYQLSELLSEVLTPAIQYIHIYTYII